MSQTLCYSQSKDNFLYQDIYKTSIRPPPKRKLVNAITPAITVELSTEVGRNPDAALLLLLLLPLLLPVPAAVPVAVPRTNVADLEVPPTWVPDAT